MRVAALPGALCLAFLSGLAVYPSASVPAARADEWTTYAHPNDMRDLAAADNMLWIATTGGALSYDTITGVFRQYPRRLAGGPVSQDLTSACYDPVNGIVYFGAADAGVSQFQVAEDRWRRFDEVPNNEIRGVSAFDGQVYVATAAGFSIRRSTSRTDLCNEIDRGCCGPDPQSCDFPSFDVWDFARADTVIWVATGGGPAEFSNGLWRAHPASAVNAARTIEGFGGSAWLATSAAQGVFRWDANAQSWAPAGGGLRAGEELGEAVRLVSTGGELLLCCNYGLYRLSGGDWLPVGLERSVRSAVLVDGTYYAVTRDGLYRGAPSPSPGGAPAWTQLLADGPPLNIPGQAIDVARDGTVWIGTLGGAMGVTPAGVWSVVRNGEGGLLPFDVFAIFADSRDRLWLGKCCCREVPKCPTQFVDQGAVSAALGSYDGWGMSEDASGRLWIGSNSGGVYVLNGDGSVLTELTGENTGQALKSTSVRTTATDGNRVWLGYEDAGLSILDHKGSPGNVAGYTWRYFSGQSGSSLPDATVSDIAVAGANDAWVLTSANLVHIQNNQKVQQVALNEGGEPRRGNALDIDARGTKWVATNNGVLRLDAAGTVTVLNTGNSDLIGNEVLDVAVDPKTGDVLFETRLGASRLHEVAEPNPGGGDVAYVYPNPFQVNGTNRLKIGNAAADNGAVFDLTGHPVARFDAAQGWDGRDGSGELATPGLYVVVVGGESFRVALTR